MSIQLYSGTWPNSNSDGTECCPEKCISKKGDQKDNFNHDIFLPILHLSLIDNNNPTNAIGVPIVTVNYKFGFLIFRPGVVFAPL